MWLLSQLTIIGVTLLICSAFQAIISFSAWDRLHNSTARLFFLEHTMRPFGSSFNSLQGFIPCSIQISLLPIFQKISEIFDLCVFWANFFQFCNFYAWPVNRLTYAFFGLILSLLQVFGYFWPKNCSDERNSPKICIRQIVT